ncbi:helix-turn-helix transcriptional regulator [Aquincola tertiaricarbonis]|uniref:helix-turn-helix transcriptional regulator n=1 Tax=Aquincola tertiaricarbonis TaxID=391953 RepID=UPI000615006E|nr:AraC family transcriptional regulator [Aquincola tertiaricarbonis]
MASTSTQPVDRLSGLLERFRVHAHLFHAGPLCGVTHFDAQEGRGFLHVLRRGEMVVTHRPRSGAPRRIQVTEPTLLLYPRPLEHQFHNAPTEGSDFVCATVDFEGGVRHPVVAALPPVVVLPLHAVDGLEQTLALLFAETEQVRCGHRLLADRLFEVLLLQLLRWLLDHPAEAGITEGTLHGLGHPKLARALTALHDKPGADWALESMAQAAGMSRSAFAAAFKQQVGITPADYLLRWRVSLAQSMLLAGSSIKRASDELGYASPASFSRAFMQAVGVSPRAWLQGRQA